MFEVKIEETSTADPLKKSDTFKIKIEEQVIQEFILNREEEEEEQVVAGVVVNDQPKPTFELEELSDTGTLKIKFDQRIRVVDDLTSITPEVFFLVLEPDESSFSELEELSFSWTVTSFEER